MVGNFVQMYLKQELPKNELASKIASVRQAMVRGGMALDRKGYSLLLEASTYLEDPQVRCSMDLLAAGCRQK